MRPLVAFVGEVEENPSVMGFETLQERLVQVLDELNREWEQDLVVPLSAPGGFPEFVAVFRNLGPAYSLARALAEAFHPLSTRAAAALGDINLYDASPDPEQMDGPAFDDAAELLYRARKEDRLLVVQSRDGIVDHLVNALTLVLYRDLQSWTARQCEVVRLYRRFRRQVDVAKQLGVSQQSVSGSLVGARWKTLTEAEEAIAEVLAPRENAPGSPSETPGGIH